MRALTAVVGPDMAGVVSAFVDDAQFCGLQPLGQAGVDLRTDVDVLGFARLPDGVQVGAKEIGAHVRFEGDLLIAADGLRVFWVVPAAKTDAILPLQVSPAPDKIVRVIVGRSEVLRPAREKEWLALSASAEESERSRWDWLRFNDRFGGAYQRRIEALSAAGVDHQVETYPARHGWVPRDTAVHDPVEAEHHWKTLVPFMAGALG